jgi:hypothetical protein
MIPNAKRASIFAFATVVVKAVAMRLFDLLQGAYDSHMEQAQMRLAPVKPRSWRDIPRVGAQEGRHRLRR